MDPHGLEATYIRDSHSALMRHIADRKYSVWLRVGAIAIGLAGGTLGVTAVVVSGDAYDMLYGSLFSSKAVPAPQRYWMLAGLLGLVLVLVAAWNTTLNFVAYRWPALAEYVGRNAIQFSPDEDDTAEKLANRARYRIEAALRRGTIGPGRPFDPANFLRQETKRVRWRRLAAAIVLMLASIGCLLRATQP